MQIAAVAAAVLATLCSARPPWHACSQQAGSSCLQVGPQQGPSPSGALQQQAQVLAQRLHGMMCWLWLARVTPAGGLATARPWLR
jgi:hypothetical protein